MLVSPLAAITAVSLNGKTLRALHTWIVQYLHIILLKILQAPSSWLLIIARQPFSSQNCNWATFTVFLVSNSSVDLSCFRLLSCWKVNLSPSVWCKADWTRFSSRILPVLISILFLFLADYKHTHNMMQPPPWLKILSVVLSDVLCWICSKLNALYSGQKVDLTIFLYSFSLVPYFHSVI
jgi:hypothetical protein